jgi:hypothetical protein
MRTTIDLPEDLLDYAKAVAHDKRQTLSKTVAELLRKGMGPDRTAGEKPVISVSPLSGFPVLHISGTITTEDVRALEDEDVEYYHSFTTKPAE